MTVPSVSSISPVKPISTASVDTRNAKPATRIGSDFVSVKNIGTWISAMMGNDKAKIRLAALRGDEKKLETIFGQANAKFVAAGAKLDGSKKERSRAVTEVKSLDYDRSPALSYGAQKAQNENATRYDAAFDALEIARGNVKNQAKAVEKYFDRMALAFQSLENLRNRQTPAA